MAMCRSKGVYNLVGGKFARVMQRGNASCIVSYDGLEVICCFD